MENLDPNTQPIPDQAAVTTPQPTQTISAAQLARLSQFAAILAYFCAKTAFKSNGFIKCISKSVAVKTYPLAKA